LGKLFLIENTPLANAPGQDNYLIIPFSNYLIRNLGVDWIGSVKLNGIAGAFAVKRISCQYSYVLLRICE